MAHARKEECQAQEETVEDLVEALEMRVDKAHEIIDNILDRLEALEMNLRAKRRYKKAKFIVEIRKNLCDFLNGFEETLWNLKDPSEIVIAYARVFFALAYAETEGVIHGMDLDEMVERAIAILASTVALRLKLRFKYSK